MSYQNLSEFIARLEAEGELLRIREKVSPILEITEITDRMSKRPGGGKALLFENVEGTTCPVITNAFGSRRRIGLALGCRNLDDLAERLREILEQSPPRSMAEKLRLIPKAVNWSRFFPRTKNLPNPPCQEVVLKGADADLGRMPILHCWPKDGGRFVTLPIVFTRGLKDGKRNAGMYRMQVYDKQTTGMHWHIHKDGSHHFHEYRKAGRPMEVAVAVGTDPAVTYAATAPMPRGVDEMILAGFIRQKPVTMVKGVTVDIEVPADAEFVIEGYVNPEEFRVEGPFGDHTGYYSLEDEYPVFHVTAITHRRNPIYSATIVGRPPMEDCYLALATERLFLPMLRTVMPEIKDYWMPWEGVFHNIVVPAIDKTYPHHARKVISGLWGMGQMSFSKAIVIVDDDEKLLGNGDALLRLMLKTVDFKKDITITEGILDVLDHSAPQPFFGSKIGIDATSRIAGERPRAVRKPGLFIPDRELLSRLEETDPGFAGLRNVYGEESATRLFLINIAKEGEKNSRFFVERLSEVISGGVCVLFDADIDLNDSSLVLWKMFNNTDPARDITITQERVIIDATRKGTEDGHTRQWPEDIVMTQEVKEKVDKMKDATVN
ncbi:menaquinone biosynthesis decarboxylase [Desulfobacterales bacterium HSG2]|nr:menaquinone biosynthesis decarboxylase [Desulfobacterales bacterium HSG2]